MRISKAIDIVDTLKPNKFDQKTKIRWLSEIDGHIYNDIISTHYGDKPENFSGYDDTQDAARELLAVFPYDQLYPMYLIAQIDLMQGDTDQYQNSYAEFNNAYEEYAKWYHRTFRPLQTQFRVL